MFFWIPALVWPALLAIFIVLAVRWRKRHPERDRWNIAYEKENPWASGIGLLAAPGFMLVLFPMLFGAQAVGEPDQRVLSSEVIVQQEDGSYASSQLAGTDNYIVFTVERDGVELPHSVNINDSTTILVVEGTTAEYAEVQDYLDNPLIWPWPVERKSWYEIRVPIGSVIQK